MRTNLGTNVQAVHDSLDSAVERGEIVGAVALVARHGHAEVVSVGRRDAEGNDPMRRDTLFRLSSMTEPITAVAALILVEDGLLQLDEPVAALIPELAEQPAARTLYGELDYSFAGELAITTRMLLTAHSGQGRLDDTAIDLLGVLVARASGQPLGAFLAERIFQPLGMSETAFHLPTDKSNRLAAIFQPNYQLNVAGGLEQCDAASRSCLSPPPLAPYAAAGLVSCVDDYYEFAQMLLTGGMSGRRRLLFEQSVVSLTTDQFSRKQRTGAAASVTRERSWDHGTREPRWDYLLSAPIRSGPNRFDNAWYGCEGELGTSWRNYPELGLVGVLMTQTEWASSEASHVVVDFWRAVTSA